MIIIIITFFDTYIVEERYWGVTFMSKKIENISIVLGCVMIFGFMLTASLVFAQGNAPAPKKSYYVEKTSANDFIEKDIKLVTKMNKKVETAQNSFEYELEIINGNVVLIDLDTGSKEAIYTKGDAKYLASVDFYYYDAAYTLIITADGNLYSNIYTDNQNKIKFRKINTNNKVTGLKVIERELKFYEYPSVEVYGLNDNKDWEMIKL